MQTARMIEEARALARQFVAKGKDDVRLPVFMYEDWRRIYRKEDGRETKDAYRTQTRRSYYLMRYLRDMGITVIPVPVRHQMFTEWALETEHDLNDGHELAHAVGEYANDPLTPITQCRHSEAETGGITPGGPWLATITTFGENPEEPEVLSVAVHRDDGSVLTTLEVLGSEYGAEAAWQKATDFLDRFKPEKVFHDRQVRRPEFCEDCNALLVHVASIEDIESAGG